MAMAAENLPASAPGTRGTSAAGRLGSGHGSVYIPHRASSLHPTEVQQTVDFTQTARIRHSKNLIYGYMVCGLSRNPTEWNRAPKTTTGKPQRSKGSVGPFLLPSVLGSIPSYDKDEEVAEAFSCALRACFANDVEICIAAQAPESTCHSFVIQRPPSPCLYGIALRLWVKADSKRVARISQSLDIKGLEGVDSNLSIWIPYCLSYLSLYPVFDLMSDFLRCTWVRWSKQPDKFNTQGVLRFMRVPAPKPNQLVQINMESPYAFCYQLPSSADNFQNFPLWPLFSCLSARHIICILEAALSPKGRIILTSQHTAILTIVGETIRFYLATWAGLYVPVAYARHVQELINEPAPYILGVTKQSRSLFTAPASALLVDLDYNRILTSQPPGFLSPRQRSKYAALLTQALGGSSQIDGVPLHLQSAYGQNMRFSAAGGVVAAERDPQVIKDPSWWDHNRVHSAISYICNKARRNFKLLSVFSDFPAKVPTTKIPTQDFVKLLHERNLFLRRLSEAWRDYIGLKHQMDKKLSNVVEHEGLLKSELAKWKTEFAELSACTEQLIEETSQLQSMIKKQQQDNKVLSSQLRQKLQSEKQLSSKLSNLNREYDNAVTALNLQQQLLDEVEQGRQEDRAARVELQLQYHSAWQERDEAQRAVVHLSSLISGQISYIERVMSSLGSSRPRPRAEENIVAKRKSFQSSGSDLTSTRPESPRISPILKQFPFPTSTSTPSWPATSKRHTMDFLQADSLVVSGADRPRSHRMSQLVQFDAEEDTYGEKVAVIAQTIRKINDQCIAAIEDLAAKRTSMISYPESSTHANRTVSDADTDSVKSDSELDSGPENKHSHSPTPLESNLSTTPDLDSRADTALSGEIDEPRKSRIIESAKRMAQQGNNTADKESEHDSRLKDLLDDQKKSASVAKSRASLNLETRAMIQSHWGILLNSSAG